MRLGDHELAIGDIFGGNAFQLCLFVLADLLAGTPLLPAAGKANAWLGALGIVLTGIYISAIIVRAERRHAGFGADSLLAIVVFVLGMWGLQIIVG